MPGIFGGGGLFGNKSQPSTPMASMMADPGGMSGFTGGGINGFNAGGAGGGTIDPSIPHVGGMAGSMGAPAAPMGNHMRNGGASRHIRGDSAWSNFSPEQMYGYLAYKNDGGHHTPSAWNSMSQGGKYQIGGNNLRLNEDGTRAWGPLRLPPGYSYGQDNTGGGGGGGNVPVKKKNFVAQHPRGTGRG